MASALDMLVILNSTLKQHINSVHEGVKVHECNVCGKSFRDTGGLKIHVKTVHNF